MATTESINVRDSYEITDEMRENIDNPFYDLDGVNSFTFINNEKMTQSALALIYNALYGLENQDKIPELEEAYRNAQAGLDAQTPKVEAARKNYYAFLDFLDRISVCCHEYSELNKECNRIVNSILYGQTDDNGNPVRDKDGNIISSGLIEIGNSFDENLKDIELVDPDLSRFQNDMKNFANVLNGITLDALTDPTPTQNGASTKGQDKLDALLVAFNTYYKAACGVDGALNNVLEHLTDEDAVLRTNLLYTLATKKANEDFCELEEKENLSTVGGVLLGTGATFPEGRSVALNSDAITEIIELLTIANAGWDSDYRLSASMSSERGAYRRSGGDENGHWDGDLYYFNLPDGGTSVFDRRGMNPTKGGYEFSSEDIERYLRLIPGDKLDEVIKSMIADVDIEETSMPVLNADGSQKIDANGNPVTETKYKYIGQLKGQRTALGLSYSLDLEFGSKEDCLNYVIGEVKKSKHSETIEKIWQQALEDGVVSGTPAICDELFLKFQNMTNGLTKPTSSINGSYGRDIAISSGADFTQDPYAYKVTEIRKKIIQSWKDSGKNIGGTGKSGYEFAESRLEEGYIQLIKDMQETARNVESRFYANSSLVNINGVSFVRPNENPDDMSLWEYDGMIALLGKHADISIKVQSTVSGEDTGIPLKTMVEEAFGRTSDSTYDKNAVFNWDPSKGGSENTNNLMTYLSNMTKYSKAKLDEANAKYNEAADHVNAAKEDYNKTLGKVEDLLNFAIRYNPYDGEGEKITKIFLNEDGTYSVNNPKAASNGSARAQTASISNEAAPASYSLYSTNAMTAPYSLNSEDFGEGDTETAATQAATSRMLNMARSAAAPATYSLNSDENVDVSLLSDSPDLANTAATLNSVDSIPQVRASSAANMQDSLENKALPYYVLAVCLTFARGVQDQMMLKISGPAGTTSDTKDLSSITGINNAIKENNRYLRWLNSLYDQYYTKCSSKSGKNSFQSSSVVVDGLTSSQVETYVNGTCGYKFSCGNFEYGKYNNMGDEGTSETANIDVEEQRNLTKISNAQEAVRMRGDELNTMSQMATTQLQNLTQKYNTFISVCSQLAKSTGDYFKTIAGNIR